MQKNDYVQENPKLCLKSIHEKILLACLSGPTIQAVSINYPKILSKKFCPKNLFAILQVFKYLWNFGHVQEKIYVPEVSDGSRCG